MGLAAALAWSRYFGRDALQRTPRRGQFSQFGPHSRLRWPALAVINPAGMAIADRVWIQPYSYLEALCPKGEVALRIGEGSYLGYFIRVTAQDTVTIGRTVMISDRVYISDTGHNYEDITRPVREQGLRQGRRVEICDGAWIGVGAVIVGQVRIGRGSVVGANAVVREDVPDHTVVAGNPAVIVRHHDGQGWRSRSGPGPRPDGDSLT